MALVSIAIETMVADTVLSIVARIRVASSAVPTNFIVVADADALLAVPALVLGASSAQPINQVLVGVVALAD